jgi:hypothetical protein
LRTGNKDGLPPEYSGGLGDDGAAAIEAFVAAGGTLICLDRAGDFAIDLFQLPLRDITHDAGADQFFGPGSILRLDLDPLHPMAYGMNPRTAGFFGFSAAYDVTAPGAPGAGSAPSAAERTVRVVARYGAEDLLISGWLEGEHVIAGRPAAVEVSVGAGRVVLIGFRAQHRAQSHATFRLLFNAIFMAGEAGR